MTKRTPNSLLQNAREKRGWKLAFVAAKLKVDPGTVGRWERGEMETTRFFQYKLAELFEAKLSELGFPDDPGEVSYRFWQACAIPPQSLLHRL